jgi:hypothetical protein
VTKNFLQGNISYKWNGNIHLTFSIHLCSDPKKITSSYLNYKDSKYTLPWQFGCKSTVVLRKNSQDTIPIGPPQNYENQVVCCWQRCTYFIFLTFQFHRPPVPIKSQHITINFNTIWKITSCYFIYTMYFGW